MRLHTMLKQVAAALAIGLALSLSASLHVPSPAEAQRKEPPKARGRKVEAVRETAYKKLNAAHEALKENDFETAMDHMDSLKRRRNLNKHEQALMWQTIGFIQSSQDDYAAAAKSFEKCIELDALPDLAQQSTIYNLSQLYLATENFPKAVETLREWFKREPEPQAHAYYMLAVAYVQNDQQEKALKPALKALEMDATPKEAWLQLALALQFERKNLKEVLALLEQLIAMYPKKAYWLQLSGVYSELGQEENALAAMDVAYAQGMLVKDRELVNLARMYLYHSIPYRAAKVMEKGFEDGIIPPEADNWQLLADSWLHAREYEKGLKPLQEAARLSEKGELYVRLGQVHLEREEWKEAAEAFRAALEKGDLNNPGNAHLLLGIAHVSAKQQDEARKAFETAATFPRAKKSAQQWLKHLSD